MASLTVFEFQLLVGDAQGAVEAADVHAIPEQVFAWLEQESLRASEDGTTNWSRLAQYRGRRAIRLSGYVGVLRAPCGYQIEAWPTCQKAVMCCSSTPRPACSTRRCRSSSFS